MLDEDVPKNLPEPLADIHKGKVVLRKSVNFPDEAVSSYNKGKIATKIMAGILVALMLLGSVGTLLYYIFA